MVKEWTELAWNGLEGYLDDRKSLHRIWAVIKSIERDGPGGIGKPEPLRGNLSGYWSRRIDRGNRIVYRIIEGRVIEITQCGSHYGEN